MSANTSKDLLKKLAPPLLTEAVKGLLDRRSGPPEWEYLPCGWKTAGVGDEGWNDISILDKQKKGWNEFLKSIEGTRPFGLMDESGPVTYENYIFHNTILSYAYALNKAMGNKEKISMLDWGGGLGNYYLLSKALAPGLKIDYHCKELPILCGYGRELHPDAHFYDSDDASFARSYDFVLASSALHYSEDWKMVFGRLARAANPYIYVTRLPIAPHVPSFVVVQRPYRYGYTTEYQGWFINRKEFLDRAAALKLELVREFLIQERPNVLNAPEQCDYRGFLFRRNDL